MNPNDLRNDAMRLIRISRFLAWTSLTLLLITITIQLTIGGTSGFTCAMDMVTIGVLSGTATLLSRAVRRLRGEPSRAKMPMIKA